MIYSNKQNIFFPEKNSLGDYNIFLGFDGPTRIEIPCTRDSLISPGLNRDVNVEYNPRNKSCFIKDYVEDWREPDDPRWNIPTEIFLFLTSYKSSSLLPGYTLFQAYSQKNKTPLKRYMRWNCMHPKDRTFSIGGIWKVPTDTFSIVRILYTGAANVKTKYIISKGGTEISEYNEGSSKLLEILNELKISEKDMRSSWNDHWHTL